MQNSKIILSIVLALTTLVTLAYQYFNSFIDLDANLVTCRQQKLDWKKNFDDLQYELKKWEYAGSACLLAGFFPIATEEMNVHSVAQVEHSNMLIRDMVYDDKIEIPQKHQFTPGDQILLCNDDTLSRAQVKNIQYIGGDSPDVIEVTFDEDPIRFPQGALILSYTSAYLTEKFHREKSSTELFKIDAKGKVSRLAQRLQDYQIRVFESLEAGKFDTEFNLTWSDRCETRDVLMVQSTGLSKVNEGTWYLSPQQLFHRPYGDS